MKQQGKAHKIVFMNVSSIVFKIAVLLTLIISFVLTAERFFSVMREKEILFQDLNLRAQRIQNRLKVNLVEPLWNVQIDQINAVIDSEFYLIDDLVEINLLDEHGDKIASRSRSSHLEQKEDSSEFFKTTCPVTKEKQTIGTVSLTFTYNFITKKVHSLVIRSFITIMIINIILILALFYGLRIIVINPINELRKITNMLAKGHLFDLKPARSKDEIGDLHNAIGSMIKSSTNIIEQMKLVSQGSYNVTISPRSENDELSLSLVSMVNELKKMDEEIKSDNWKKSGLAELSKLIALSKCFTDDAQETLIFIAQYISAYAATFYAFQNQQLHWLAGYARSSQLPQNKTIALGQGLLGEVAQKKKRLIIKDLDETDLIISSSILYEQPKEIVILPILRKDELIAVLELGTLKPFSKNEIEFLDAATAYLGIAMHSNVDVTPN